MGSARDGDCRIGRSWANNSEWVAPMPDGEGIVGVAVGKSWVAAATSAHRLRLFTASGLQSFVLEVRPRRLSDETSDGSPRSAVGALKVMRTLPPWRLAAPAERALPSPRQDPLEIGTIASVANACGSLGSTKVVSIPKRGRVYDNRLWLPP